MKTAAESAEPIARGVNQAFKKAFLIGASVPGGFPTPLIRFVVTRAAPMLRFCGLRLLPWALSPNGPGH